MQLSLSQKLLLAFLSLTLLVLLATLGLARWSFQQGFLDYVNALEQGRLELVRDALVDEYRAAKHSWASLDRARFGEILRNAGGTPAGEPRTHRPPRQAMQERRPGPALGPPRGPGPGQHPPRRRHGPPTALYDANNQQILGDALSDNNQDLIRLAIQIDGETIAELRSEPHRELNSAQDTAFSKQQLRNSWVIALVALLLSLALSLTLARGLLAPIRRMIDTVASLSSGDYSARLQETRRDELGELMSNIDRLGVTLEGIRSSRRRLFADISHELRTPLTVLNGEIEAMKDGIRKLDHQQLESLSQELGRLGVLIDDLYELSVSDIGGLRYSFAETDLSDCVDQVIGTMAARARDHGIEIRANYAGPVLINADLNRLDRLFQNLLENSLSYTDAPGSIEISVAEVDNSVLIEINDTPPGVSAAECEHLFEPMYRYEASRNRSTGGAGLGLAICHNIVEAHHGNISASPSPMGGLQIRIEFPLANGTSA